MRTQKIKSVIEANNIKKEFEDNIFIQNFNDLNEMLLFYDIYTNVKIY